MTDFADTHTQQALAGLGYLLLRSSADAVAPGRPLPMVQPPALPEETFMFVDADIDMPDFMGPRTPRPAPTEPEPVHEPVLEQSLPVTPAVSYEATSRVDESPVLLPLAAPPVDYPPSGRLTEPTPVVNFEQTPPPEPDPEPVAPEPAPVENTPFIDYTDGGYRRGDSGSRMSDLAELD